MPRAKINKTYIITNELCSYCNTLSAKFAYVNGKFCCEETYTSCPEIKNKNSKGVKNSEGFKNRSYHETYKNLSDDIKIRMAWSKNKTSYSDLRISSKNPNTKKNLIQENVKDYKCEICDIADWNDKPITLELDHIDGNNQNHHENNLRLLCPNCHSQTDTFRGRNINKNIKIVEDDIFIKELLISKSIRQCLINLKLAPKGGNYNRAYNLIYSNNIQHLMK